MTRSATPKTPGESARQKITRVVESWFLTEPLLFAAWTMHEVVEQPTVATIRVGRGKVEFNANFIASLRRNELSAVLEFEAMRILLGHPYSRRQPKPDLSYSASNLTVQECLRTTLPIPRPREALGGDEFDHQYFEYYYNVLSQRETDSPPEDDPNEQPRSDPDDDSASPEQQPGATVQPANDLASYTNPESVGEQNTAQWDADELLKDELAAAITQASEADDWGSIAGQARERLLANLRPPLDYRGVLRSFRQSVLAVDRRLTRMKPSRRYGFGQMGSRYDFTTKLLFAVDVSGSMTHRELQLGFSVANRFFQYGIREIDVIWFDTQIHGSPITFRKARHSLEVTGRGGTDFRPIIDFVDAHREYDGVIVYTDGEAPIPRMPVNRRTQLLWLFSTRASHEKMARHLRPLGRTAFLKPSRQPVT